MQPGIFLGWELLPGHKFRNTYLVVPLSSFKKGASNHVWVHRVQEVRIPHGTFTFPLRAPYETALHDLSSQDDIYEDLVDSIAIQSESEAMTDTANDAVQGGSRDGGPNRTPKSDTIPTEAQVPPPSAQPQPTNCTRVDHRYQDPASDSRRVVYLVGHTGWKDAASRGGVPRILC